MRDFVTEIRLLGQNLWALREVVRVPRWWILVTFVAMIAAAVLEGVGVSLLLPLLQLILARDDAGGPLSVIAPELSHAARVALMGAGVFAVIVVKNVVLYVAQWLSSRVQYRLVTDLRAAVFQRLLTADHSVFERRPVGELVNLFQSETIRTQLALENVLLATQKLLVAAVYVLAILVISWQLSVAAAVMCVLLGLAVVFVQKRILKAGTEMTAKNELLSTRLSESFGGIHVIHTAGGESKSLNDFCAANHQQAYVRRHLHLASAMLLGVLECLGFAGAIVLTVWAYAWLVTPQAIAPAQLLTFGYVLLRLLPVVNQVYNLKANILSQAGGVSAVLETLQCPQFPTRPFGRRQLHDSPIDSISFLDVGFSYSPDKQTLQDISFEVQRGSNVALVGPSGAGKSTVASILLRLREPTQGSVLVDGTDYWEIDPASWHERVAYVEQTPFIFHASVLENIIFGLDAVSVERVAEVLDACELGPFTRSLPEGIHTICGERGTALSGGQRQRLALARALIRDPDVLVLDEATAALDTVTEKRIHDILDANFAHCARLTIAHRLSTVRTADWVVVLEDGRIVDQGTWDDLSRESDSFREILTTASVA